MEIAKYFQEVGPRSREHKEYHSKSYVEDRFKTEHFIVDINHYRETIQITDGSSMWIEMSLESLEGLVQFGIETNVLHVSFNAKKEDENENNDKI